MSLPHFPPPGALPPPFADKPSLRREALARCTGLEAAARAAAAAAVVARGLDAAMLAAAGQAVALFASLPKEIDTIPLARALDAAGRALALPAVIAPDAPLEFRRWRPGEALVRGPMGVPEPAAEACVVVPALIFVPLTAFDRRGFRIGYGGGYYDRTLGALEKTGRPVAVGLAFAVQEVARVPDQPHDIRLDRIVTERETIDCRSAS
ncbi:5-formyltetrahydrofolate cyclo-ligase [Blastochloris sulfoviridis]|uniref:5-formyltetrahydrofolate cyclo-ligase n=1 Tax=Blastochloris sulfoviridis TaxID=50712 RepID=A0A5M6I581_9HYPH|nr:5-formyltetrahydrofolate cyclo-ligase [Blastochloris sulfoviridis]KAA5603391.1 5-formyltetrahydrofolate cyclo-ligase [Blastochloris sulfoviridis]